MKKYLSTKILLPAVFLIGGILWLISSKKNLVDSTASVISGSSPATFPDFILTVMIILSGIVLLQEIYKAYKSDTVPVRMDRVKVLKLAVLALSMFLYGTFLRTFGFIPVSIVLVFIALLLFGQRNKIVLAAVPVCASIAVFVLFTYGLDIMLP